MKEYRRYFAYTTCTENEAIDEVILDIEKVGLEVVSSEVVSSDRACRNAYGKEMSEEEFDEIDPDSDEAWFNDYDFILAATIRTDKSEEELDKLLLATSYWIEDYEKWLHFNRNYRTLLLVGNRVLCVKYDY